MSLFLLKAFMTKVLRGLFGGSAGMITIAMAAWAETLRCADRIDTLSLHSGKFRPFPQ
jgi:hypothetical protein